MGSTDKNSNSNPQKQRIATMEDPAVAAAAEGRFRFANEEQAKDALDKICRRFTIAKDSPAPDDSGKHAEAKIWIREFNITEEEKEKGVRGNYAYIKIKRVNGGRYALVAEKLTIDVSHHPERERPKTRHPNWGHPVLRAALAEKSYPSLEQAYKQLMALHLEYPEVTIPGADTMHVMVYSHHDDHSLPIDKIVLKVRVLSEGGVKLVVKGKDKKKTEMKTAPSLVHPIQEAIVKAYDAEEAKTAPEANTTPKKTITQKLAETSESTGKFAKMIVQRRKKRTPVRKPPANTNVD